MNELQTFMYHDVRVRTVNLKDEPWFVLKDVCDILGITNATVTANRLEDDEVTKFDLGGQAGTTNIINESGLYHVILRSDKSEANHFASGSLPRYCPQSASTECTRRMSLYLIPIWQLPPLPH